MKKTLLIVTALMALSLPVQAEQTQVNQTELGQQVKSIQTETNFYCKIVNGRKRCY